jgi:AMP-binding enzyme
MMNSGFQNMLLEAGFAKTGTLASIAARHPTLTAISSAKSLKIITFRDLDMRSSKIAAFLALRGARPGDIISIKLGRDARLFEVVWGAQKAGLHCQFLRTAANAKNGDCAKPATQSKVFISEKSSYEDGKAYAEYGEPWLFDQATWLAGDLDHAIDWMPEPQVTDPSPDDFAQIEHTHTSFDNHRKELAHQGCKPGSAELKCSGSLDDPLLLKWCLAGTSLGATIVTDASAKCIQDKYIVTKALNSSSTAFSELAVTIRK